LTEPNDSQYVTIARIQKVQGRRGEVAAAVLTDFPERFHAGAEMALAGPGARQTVTLESAWVHKDRMILKFRGIESISDAEKLRGLEIQIPVSERKELPPGAVYLSDLVGCTVMEEGEIMGKVESVDDSAPVPLLEVASAHGEVLIPFAEEICKTIDLERKQIHVRLPEGLKELNRSTRASRGSP
jgi:16S rRNA processing protein RimM